LAFTDWVAPTWANLPGLLLLGIAGTAAPYCIIRAFKYAEASAVTPFNFLRLPITAGAAFLLFDEPTEFWTWVGAGMIFAAAYFMTRAEHRAVDVATKR
jgi:drug/metabolite transporter (DMT)-like permease